jgi:hypothetical protein
MTEAKIQAPVDRGLLQPKAEVEWRAAAGEEFPSEDVKEQVVFASFFERDFNPPSGTSFAACCTTTGWSWYRRTFCCGGIVFALRALARGRG